MTTRLPACWLILISFAVVTSRPVAVFAAEPLAPRIDQLIEAGQVGPIAPLSSDSDFLRRITLDLTGDLPSSVEARAFLDDATPNKRELLIDRLLASPRFPIHMANVFDVMFMERRPAAHVPVVEWQQYLQASFVANKPYDQLAREILSADGIDPALRPDWPEALYLFQRKTRLSYTLEAPSDWPLPIRVNALVAGMRAALAAL